MLCWSSGKDSWFSASEIVGSNPTQSTMAARSQKGASDYWGV